MPYQEPYNSPELWGGIECTINRIGSTYRDQLSETGHYDREDDIALLATTGIKKLRYPVLWEKHQQQEGSLVDFSWAKKQLTHLRDNGVDPIAGLLHHGNGPAFTSLLDEAFPDKFADYAEQVAREFPWIEHYTPINEPLTTARFSGLYGLWFPHLNHEVFFYQMVVNQAVATVKAMQKIRAINPAAKLIQTEDLCKVHSTPHLQYQADYENERRWLSYDLICGKVDRDHYSWKSLLHAGISVYTLHFLFENRCVPDVMGFNYYPTSERYLDDKLERYPAGSHGDNGRDKYVDTEAFRVGCASGLEALLTEAWTRYKIPLAITECYLDCSREEQMRWFMEAWTTACTLSKQGVTVNAVTAWSMLGSYDWDSLLTEKNNHYAPGVFDTRFKTPRATAMVKLLRELGTSDCVAHPLIHEQGWWHHEERSDSVHESTYRKTCLVLLGTSADPLLHSFVLACQVRSIETIVVDPGNCALENTLAETVHTRCAWAMIDFYSMTRNIGDVAEDDQFQKAIKSVRQKFAIPVLTLIPPLVTIDGVVAKSGLASSNEETADLAIQLPTDIEELPVQMNVAAIALNLLIDELHGSYEIVEGMALSVDMTDHVS